MRYVRITVVVGGILLILGGCGQRGPLYSPQKAPNENTFSATKVSIPPVASQRLLGDA